MTTEPTGVDGAGTDAGARRRLTDDLDTNLMVVAGAGTGKTTALVARLLALVRSRSVGLGEIAAITFTEAAAAELRRQVRTALAAALSAGDDSLTATASEIDDAAIETLHSFARRILVEHAIDAGLPPGFAVLDDTAEVADFAARWARFADALFEDPGAERALVLGFSAGLRPGDLATVAWDLQGHWDRLDDGGVDHLIAAPRCDETWPVTDAAAVIAALDRALDTATWCSDDDDLMVRHLRGPLAHARSHLVAAGPDTPAVLQLLTALPPFRYAHGRQENWAGRIAEARAACAEAEQARLDFLDQLRRAVLGDLVGRVATFTLDSAEHRRLEGRLTFHDLLVHARRLVRAGGEPLSLLRRRYRRILIDEFQDTDPIQFELAARLVGTADGDASLSGARAGGLFAVGDPEQSIYRFRRADVDLVDRVGATIGHTVTLDANFRSVPGIVAFVNVVFGQIFGAGSRPGQAPHHPLRAVRPGLRGERSGPSPATPAPTAAVQLSFDGIEPPAPGSAFRGRRGGRARLSAPPVPPRPAAVVTLGGALPSSAPEIRRRAAAEAAAAIAQVVDEGWPVEDPDDGRQRPVRFADVALLIPARSSLATLEEALEARGVPYRLEGAALLWGAEEVREVLTVLRAVDDPADAVAVLGALRSTGLACGDDDLVTWHDGGGSWDPRAAAPVGLETHPVAVAMALLDRLHRRRWWSEPSALVAEALDELGCFALALSHRRPRDHWHRLRWLQDQARLFDEAPGGTLRSFLRWAGLRAAGDGRAGDGRAGGVGPPDPDDDAVRVMTIHGAKGLEFPVVVLAGLERDQADAPPPAAVVWTEHDRPEIRVGNFRTSGFEQAGLRQQYLDVLEQHRLLYVAMTRARDHLLLCLHHKPRVGAPDGSLAALVTRLCAENPHLWRTLDLTRTDRRHERVGAPPDQPLLALPASLAADRAALLASGRRRPATTAPAVAGHTTGVRPDAHQPAAVDTLGHRGRAVHAALADLDLATQRDATGRTAGEVAAARAQDCGVAGHDAEVSAMVVRALRSPTVARARRQRTWRHVSVTVPLTDGAVLEGVVDLVIEESGGLVVVDYTTERHHGGADDDGSLAAHRLQVATDAAALEASTGLSVRRGVLVFLGDEEPYEHVIDGADLDDARRRALEVAGSVVGS